MKAFVVSISIIFLLIVNFECFSQNFRKKIFEAYNLAANNNIVNANVILHEAILLKRDTGYKVGLSEFYLGRNFFSLNKMDSAIFWLGECIVPLEKTRNYTCLSNAHAVLAAIELQYVKRSDIALFHYKQQAQFALLCNNLSSYYDGLANVGATYLNLGNRDSAVHYLTKVLNDTSSYNTSKAIASLTVGDLYFKEKKYKSASHLYENTLVNLDNTSHIKEKFIGLNNLSSCYFELRQYDKQLHTLLEAEKILPPNIENSSLRVLWGNISDAYFLLKNYKLAYQYKEKELSIADSIQVRNIKDATAEMDAKFKVRQTQDSLTISKQNLKISEAATLDRERKFIFALIGAFGIAVVAILYWRNATLRKKANFKLTQEKAIVDALAIQLNEANQTKSRLFSVISHDLRSPISTLYSQLRMQELKKQEEGTPLSGRIIPLLDTMEDLLVWSKSQMDKFSLFPMKILLLPLFEDLLSSSSFKAESRNIQFELKIPSKLIVISDENLLKTIYRNIITNAIQHGQPDSLIKISSNSTDKKIEIAISNASSESDFKLLKAKWQIENVSSDFNGLGNVLIHEFAKKIDMELLIAYVEGEVVVTTILPLQLDLERITSS